VTIFSQQQLKILPSCPTPDAPTKDMPHSALSVVKKLPSSHQLQSNNQGRHGKTLLTASCTRISVSQSQAAALERVCEFAYAILGAKKARMLLEEAFSRMG
jgi:hypothetical protein